jgi:DNA polymerase-1
MDRCPRLFPPTCDRSDHWEQKSLQSAEASRLLTWLANHSEPGDSGFFRDLLSWRKLQGDISKYKLYPKHLRLDEDGGEKVVFCLKPDTNTGRLSASNAAIQQVPKNSEIREAFVARPGCKLIVADYSALEMRMLAHWLADKFDDWTLANDLEAEDFHQATADRLDMSRDYAKAVNYSVNYDKSAMGLGLQLGVSTEEAQQILDGHGGVYPAIKRLKDWLEARALRRGFVETLLGRRRLIPELRSEDEWEYRRGYRKLMSTLIQGSSADFVTMAMLYTNTNPRPELVDRGYFNEVLYDCKVKQLCQVHDELIFECPEEYAEVAALEVERAMMNTRMDSKVPFPVNVVVYNNWAEGK